MPPPPRARDAGVRNRRGNEVTDPALIAQDHRLPAVQCIVDWTRSALMLVLAAALTVGSFHPAARRKLHHVLQETKWWIRGVHPDGFYRQAEVSFQAGDFVKSRLAWTEALRLQPHHARARALFTEIEFLLGRGSATLTTGEFDRFMNVAGNKR